jgi:hypothetical protein
MNEKSAPVKISGLEEISVAGFCNFCRNNVPLILAVSFTLFFAYGAKLFWYSIGVDTNHFMADKSGSLLWLVQCGRVGAALLSKLWHINEFNPYAAVFSALCLIWLFTISWCYIIAIFSKNTGRNNKLIPFALVFMTVPVWAEMLYFSCAAMEATLIISLCPYVIYLFYRGFLDSKKGNIVCAFILLVFMSSVYEAVVPLFCGGVFACFVLLQERSNYEPRVYRNLCLKFLITVVSAVAVYFIISKIIIPAVFHIEKADYLDNMFLWGKTPIWQNLLKIAGFIYTFTIGYIPSVLYPAIASYTAADTQTIERLAGMASSRTRFSQNMLLLPVAIFFFVKIILVMRRVIPSKRKLLYMLAGIGIPLSIILMAVMLGNKHPYRSLWALPFAYAFMFFYLIESYSHKKKIATVIVCVALLTAVHQAEITAQLFYSDNMRYNEDVRLAFELDKLITRAQPDNKKLPVALIGKYEAASRFRSNFLQGESLGLSMFECDFAKSKPYSDVTHYGLAFMKTLGIFYDEPNDAQLDKVFKEAALMPAYPDSGCVKRVQDIIVVRISKDISIRNMSKSILAAFGPDMPVSNENINDN